MYIERGNLSLGFKNAIQTSKWVAYLELRRLPGVDSGSDGRYGDGNISFSRVDLRNHNQVVVT
mgnify:CR=1 FL=1